MKEKWGYKTTPGSNHEFCTVFDYDGKAIARHVAPENAVKMIALPDLVEAAKEALAILPKPGSCPCEARDKLIAALQKAGVTL